MSKKFKIVFVSVCLIVSCLSFGTLNIKSNSNVKADNKKSTSATTSKKANNAVKKDEAATTKAVKPDVGRPATCTDWTGRQGAGTEASPYEIVDASSLYCMADLVNAGVAGFTNSVWSLTGDITLDSVTDDPWQPIGTSTDTPFSGSFYGNDHTISGIYIDDPLSDNQGLIGYADTINTISDIKIVDSYINGKNNIGGFIGSVNTITDFLNCYNKGAVSGVDNIGGLIGSADDIDTISNSNNQSTVSGNNNTGGLIGSVNILDTLSNSYNYVNIHSGTNAGGLVGYVHDSLNIISRSYNQGGVSGTNSVGGFVGYVHETLNTISDSYNQGNVSGNSGNIGGFVGTVNKLNTISYSYNQGNVSSSGNNVGGLIGMATTTDVIKNSGAFSAYITGAGNVNILVGSPTDLSNTTINDNYYYFEVKTGTGSDSPTTTQQQNAISVDFDILDDPYFWTRTDGNGLSFSGTIWSITDVEALLYPRLNHPEADTSALLPWIKNKCAQGQFTGTGSGTDANPYKIATKADLYCMATMVNNGFSNITDVWSLTDNITLDSTSDIDKRWVGQSGQWTPIGSSRGKFNGSLYGANHWVSGIYICNNSSYQSLIGDAYIINTISDIGITDSYINSDSPIENINDIPDLNQKAHYTASLVSDSNFINTLSNSYNNSTIIGGNDVGGLVGGDGNITNLSNCYNLGSISGENNVGGLIGTMSTASPSLDIGTFSDSYNQGDVSGKYYVGGLIGYLHSDDDIISRSQSFKISNSYNQGDVSGKYYVGGLIGEPSCKLILYSSYNTGNCFGEDNIGGLIGGVFDAADIDDSVDIYYSYNRGVIIGTDFVGGLVGVNELVKTLSDSYNQGAVFGSHAVGGLVGASNNFETITFSYNNADVSGESVVGGLIGMVMNSINSIRNSGVFSDSIIEKNPELGNALGIVSMHILVGVFMDQNQNANLSNNYYYSGLQMGTSYDTLASPTVEQRQNATAVKCLMPSTWWNTNITKNQTVWNTSVVNSGYFPILKQIPQNPKKSLPAGCSVEPTPTPITPAKKSLTITKLKIKASKKKIDITISFSNNVKNANVYIYFKNKKVGKIYKVKNNHIIIKGKKKVKKFYKALKKAVKKAKIKYKKKKKYLIIFKYLTAQKSIKIKALY